MPFEVLDVQKSLIRELGLRGQPPADLSSTVSPVVVVGAGAHAATAVRRRFGSCYMITTQVGQLGYTALVNPRESGQDCYLTTCRVHQPGPGQTTDALMMLDITTERLIEVNQAVGPGQYNFNSVYDLDLRYGQNSEVTNSFQADRNDVRLAINNNFAPPTGENIDAMNILNPTWSFARFSAASDEHPIVLPPGWALSIHPATVTGMKWSSGFYGYTLPRYGAPRGDDR